MHWNWPEIKTTRSMYERGEKIKDEIEEYMEAETPTERDKEAVDILHATETFLRRQFQGREEVLDRLIHETFLKNDARQYYTKECF